eukprot:Platyproteum_vivax@DN13347_c0_g1_i1.p1
MQMGLGVSLFEHLVNEGLSPVILLDVQRRMHSSIAEFPNHHFYNGLLKNGITDQERPPVPISVFNYIPNDHRVVLVNSTSAESIVGTSKSNLQQADQVVCLLREALEVLPASQIGVLTPYLAQKRNLRKLIQRKFDPVAIDGLRIDTVDGFQGMERELIIFSTVRCNKWKTIGFLGDLRRMNVALTRARRAVVVVGNLETLSEHPTWGAWCQWIKSKLAIVDYEDCYEFQPPPPKIKPARPPPPSWWTGP